MFNTHICKLDDRGICEQCMEEQRRTEYYKEVYATANNILTQRIPETWEEFPTPFEFGQMESGEWN